MKCAVTLVLVLAVHVCGAATAAAPDEAALDHAREEARVLLADGFRSLNEGRITLLELADRVADMAAGSNSPAMTRVLQEGAFNMYRKAGGLKRAAEKHVPFWINLGTDVEFAFAACPAGSFQMGCDGDFRRENFRHTVNFPRPFWMARLQTTKRLYDMFNKVADLSEEERANGGMDLPMGGLPRTEMEAFCEFLTLRNRSRIPEGYVFRLPTDAEWEYALNAGSDDPDDPYVKFRNGDKTVADEIAATLSFVNKRRREQGADEVEDGQGTPFQVGQRRPNAWGIFDMLGNGGEALLDTIPNVVTYEFGEGIFDKPFDFGYEEGMTDPVRYTTATNRLALMRGTARWCRFNPQWYGRVVVECCGHWHGSFTFRVVLAPDILRERGLEGGAK